MKPQIVRHGEVLLVPTELPKEAKLIKETKKEIVAHSETGHHHVLVADKPFKVYSWNGDTYLGVAGLSELLHEKTGTEVHKTHKIVPAIYKVNFKKAYDYFAKTLTRVRD